jgi:hypothetical protein
MTITAAETSGKALARPYFLEGFAAMHEAMRRDAERLPRAVERVADRGHAGDLARLDRWYERFHFTIVHHHEREDDVVWPELRERAPEFSAFEGELTLDHHRLDHALSAMAVVLREPGTPGGVDAACHLRDLLFDHLAREEAAAFGLIASHFTAEEYGEIEHRLMKGTALRSMIFEVPWVFEGMDPYREAEMLKKAPAPVRFLQRTVLPRWYRNFAAPLLAVSS